jgi:3-methylcrotonyl-CoA carboxylase alpha subunit
MRIVTVADDFAAALASCQREAEASFGDNRVLIEKYLQRPRHIEMQVFADGHGQAIHLFERDCSVQRRHQKVLEEAPAPGMTAQLRKTMGDAAVAAARAVGYVGAGTVEFIVPGDGAQEHAFYFMEMNTRLQVEHPVTEMITGLDLVEWQLRVAAGEALPLAQAQITTNGHALEARIYAEDAERDFLPATGRITHLATPAESAHVRIDTGIAAGDSITPWYDPMIAKLIVWDTDRQSALARMQGALAAYEVAGITTNTAFLARLVACKAFATAELDTGLIARNHDALFPPAQPAGDAVLALACCAELLQQQHAAAARGAASADPASPWALGDGWRLNQDNQHVLRFRANAGDEKSEILVRVHYRVAGWEIELGGLRRTLNGERLADGRLAIRLDDIAVTGTVVRQGANFDIFQAGLRHTLHLHDPLARSADAEESSGSLAAPMPGKIVAVLVKPGATVARGAPLLILEAMKMEHTICAPAEGVVTAVFFRTGEQVSEGAKLISMDAGNTGAASR